MLMQRMTPRFDAMRPTLYPPYRDRAAWQLDIDWLTGEVTLARAEAPR